MPIDAALLEVATAIKAADPDGMRFNRVFRNTLDQLYDGQHTGRYSWNQLYKTEKTHFGTLIEINLRREFSDIISDGKLLDFQICNQEIDCKFSQRVGGWMIPPECFGQLMLVTHVDDQLGLFNVGVVRATTDNIRTGVNRDSKSGLNARGVERINWIFRHEELSPNVLLKLDHDTLDAILSKPSGQQRVNELFRRVTNTRISRNTIATLAQQDDFMKRVRYNGGARSTLAAEGYLIPGGDFASHREVARQLGIPIPSEGEFVSTRVVPVVDGDSGWSVQLGGRLWRTATADEVITEPAPMLPTTRVTTASNGNEQPT